MLQVSNLNVWYGITEVLRDVSFEVPRGAIVALLGGNGSGKTTVLNTLSGMLRPKAGSIRLEDADIAGQPPDSTIRMGLAQVPQGREVFASMSVDDNLEMGAVTRRGRKAIRQSMEEIYELFPVVAEKRRMKAGSLSGGEQQQVAIARALMSQPRLLLMDEPSAGLSPRIVERVIEIIKNLNRRGLTILLVEQNVGVAAAVAEDAHVLKSGEIVFTGPAPELVGNQEVLASYMGG